MKRKEETVQYIKTPGLNDPETYVLTYNNFNTYLVLIFIELNKTQIYKTPYRDSPHQEIEIVMNFKYLNVFEPIEHKEDYVIRKANEENFFSKVEMKNNFM